MEALAPTPPTIEGIRIFQLTTGEGSPTLKEQAALLWESGYGIWIIPVPPPTERNWKLAGGDEPGVPVLSCALSLQSVVRDDKTFDTEYDFTVGRLAGDEASVWCSTRPRMTNRRMWEELDKGKCIDIGSCPRRENGDYHLWYLDADWIDKGGIDFCNARIGSWIHSIGQHKETGEVWASHATRLYQNPDYRCLWLR